MLPRRPVHQDAARELGCPRGTVLSRLATARKRLAERLTRRGVTLPAALTVAGTGLTGRVVSATATVASRFRSGAVTLGPAITLADGVLRTMARATLLTAIGGTVLATALVTGVGWVAAQQGPNVAPSGGDGTPLAAADPVAEPPKADPKAADERKLLEERQRNLEALEGALKEEIAALEKQAEVLGATDKSAARLAALHMRFAEADTALASINREVAKMEAELTVLKKRVGAMAPGEPSAALIQEIVARDPRVVATLQALKRAQAEFQKSIQLSPGDAPAIQLLKVELAKLEQSHGAMQKRATEEAIEAARTAENKIIRERIAKLSLDLEIQKEVRTVLQAERDALAKLVDESTANDRAITLLRKAMVPQHEALAKVRAELLALRLGRESVAAPPRGDSADAKLDLLIREVAELRKEVRELKKQK